MNRRKLKGEGKIYKIEDMTCNHCVNKVTETVNEFDGVQKVNINLKKRLVEIIGEFDEPTLLDKLKNAGYTPESQD